MDSTEARTHSALHVVKGAVVAVLGPRRTTSTHATAEHASLTVAIDRRPTPEEIASIEKAANAKIAENAEVLEFEMERPEAEGHFGTAIYDAFPVPDVRMLTIVRIADWEVNCCNARHVDSTGELMGVKIDAARFRPGKGQLEIEFHLEA